MIGSNSKATVTVSGIGSIWDGSYLFVGTGEITITNGGLVKTSDLSLTWNNASHSFVNIDNGGMLALGGKQTGTSDFSDNLTDFLDEVGNADAIRWWDDSCGDWAPITTATAGTDYTLEYLTEGDLAGYTVLTVGVVVPEPGTVALILSGLLAMGFACRPATTGRGSF